MAYEHKTTVATDVPKVRWFTVSPPPEDQVLPNPEWNFGADPKLEARSYDYNRGDQRFIQHVSDQGLGVAMVKYVNGKVTEDGRARLVSKVEDGFNITWTVLEPS